MTYTKQQNLIFRTVYGAAFAALTFLGTMIAVPNGFGGNFNFGDAVLIVAVWCLGGIGVAAGAVGATLADLAAGYAIYAPGTAAVKLLMGICVLLLALLWRRRSILFRVCSALAAEAVMVAGYFLYETFLFGFAVALPSVPFNAAQAGIAVLIAPALMQILQKTGLAGRISETRL